MDVQVRRYAFRGLEVKSRFYLGEVTVATIVPMAYTFDYVKAAKNKYSLSYFKMKKDGALHRPS
jgi:hypothetical protein